MTSLTVSATVTARLWRPAHMVGVPLWKSCKTIVRTTLVPCWRAVLIRAVIWLEFQTA